MRTKLREDKSNRMNKRKASDSFGGGNQAVNSVVSVDDIMVLINNGQVDRLNEAIENIEDVNARNDDSVLMRACRLGNEEIVNKLLSRGADVSLVSRYSGHSALSLASHYGHESIVKLLLEHDADPNISEGRLPLVEACTFGHLAIIDLLLNNGASVDSFPKLNDGIKDTTYHDFLNPLMVACHYGHFEVVQLLIHHKACIYSCFRYDNKFDGFSPLTFASRGYHWDIVKLLVTAGADINENAGYIKGFSIYSSPLMYASAQGKIDVVKELLDLGANINGCRHINRERPPYTPLMSASAHGQLNIVRFILAHKKFTALETIPLALVEACEHGGDQPVISVLRPYVPDLNALIRLGMTLLAFAVKHGRLHAIPRLLELGACINAPANREGDTHLMVACALERLDTVQLLLVHGVSVDARNALGRTALGAYCTYMKAEYDNERNAKKPVLPLVPLLVEFGADINAVDNDGNTPLMIYIARGRDLCTEVAQVLLDSGADVTVENRRGKTVSDILQGISDAIDERYRERESFESEPSEYSESIDEYVPVEELMSLFWRYEESNQQTSEVEPVLK